MVLMAEPLIVKCGAVKCEQMECEQMKCEQQVKCEPLEVFDPYPTAPEDPLNDSSHSIQTDSFPNFVNQSMTSAKKGRKRKHNDQPDKDQGKPRYLEVKVNIVPRAEETSRPACSQVKKRHKYCDDRLELLCEWSGCGRTLKEADSFLRHVSGHCSEAGLLPNPAPLQDTFLCLWDECGFQTTDSRETVRHINFHSFHTKVKAAGAALVARLGLTPCSLSREGRNLLPQLSLPWTCSWPDCVVGEDWEVAQVQGLPPLPPDDPSPALLLARGRPRLLPAHLPPVPVARLQQDRHRRVQAEGAHALPQPGEAGGLPHLRRTLRLQGQVPRPPEPPGD